MTRESLKHLVSVVTTADEGSPVHNELMALIDQWVAEVIGEDEIGMLAPQLEAIYRNNHGNVGRAEIFETDMESKAERNQLRDEQRKRAGINVQTKKRKGVKK